MLFGLTTCGRICCEIKIRNTIVIIFSVFAKSNFFLNKLIIYVNQSTIEFGQALFQDHSISYSNNLRKECSRTYTSLAANGIVKPS
jgi:hypothetical protein